MVEEGIRRFTLNTPDWGELRLLRPLPEGEDPWGVFAPLKGTDLEPLIPVVSGEDFSHALHGRATPLMNVIGRPPQRLLKMIPDPYRVCAFSAACLLHNTKTCHPCFQVPDCYESPLGEAASAVVLGWRDGRYVVVVEGEEFSL